MTCASVNHVIINFDSSRCSACPVCERDAEIARLQNDRLERIATKFMSDQFAHGNKSLGLTDQSYLAADVLRAAKALIAELDKEAK